MPHPTFSQITVSLMNVRKYSIYMYNTVDIETSNKITLFTHLLMEPGENRLTPAPFLKLLGQL